MNNQKILIVGGAGFVGSNLAHFILNTFDVKELLIVDNLLSADPLNVPISSKVKMILGSITNDHILNTLPNDLDYVFHLSCYHGNQSSIVNPLEDHENNSLTSLKLFNRLKDIKTLKKVVYSAAGCAVAKKTYGEATPTDEDSTISLFHDSPYSMSKLIGEMYGNYFYSQFELPFVKARFQNIYGPREILGAGQWRGTINTVWRNVTPTFIWKALKGEPLQLEANGESSRDFIFVEDVVRGLVACALKGKNGESYNLASGVETKILNLAELIIELTGSKSELILKPQRKWDNSGTRFGSTEKSKNEIDFEAQISLKKGLSQTVEWTKSNKKYIQQCIDKHNIFL
tara:strand:+ start:14926 stop:15957 length:1032 start_codon:yes stop_codon:yes gene_type:complete